MRIKRLCQKMNPLSRVVFYELDEVCGGDLEAAEVSGTNACGMGEELADYKAL